MTEEHKPGGNLYLVRRSDTVGDEKNDGYRYSDSCEACVVAVSASPSSSTFVSEVMRVIESHDRLQGFLDGYKEGVSGLQKNLHTPIITWLGLAWSVIPEGVVLFSYSSTG